LKRREITIIKLTICWLLLTILSIIWLAGCKEGISTSSNSKPTWLTFTKANTTSILNDNINTIFIAGKGEVWFGSDSSTFSFYKGTWSFLPPDSFSYGTTKKYREVFAITGGYDGSLWFGLNGGGIRRFNGNNPYKRWQQYSEPEIPGMFIKGLAASKGERENIWVTTLNGVAQYIFTNGADPTEGQWIIVQKENLTSEYVRCITMNPVNEWVFLGTDFGISYYSNNGWVRHKLPGGYDSPIISIAVDRSNTIWCGKMTGVTSFNPGKNEEHHYTPLNTSGNLPEGFVNAVMTDFFGKTRWFGTNQGLVRLSDQTWTLFTTKNTPELPSNVIQALSYDYIFKNLWIGTDKGIVVYNEGGVKL
jgi:ligand-binding sensor domain-containing protein